MSELNLFEHALACFVDYPDTVKHDYVGHELTDKGIYEIAVKIHSRTKFPMWPTESLKINGNECIDAFGNKGKNMQHYTKSLEKYFDLSNVVNLSATPSISLAEPAEVISYNIIKYKPGFNSVYMFAN